MQLLYYFMSILYNSGHFCPLQNVCVSQKSMKRKNKYSTILNSLYSKDFYINICVFLNLIVMTVMVGESDYECAIFENSLLL